MNREKHAELNRLFSKLEAWPSVEAISLAPLVAHALDILSVITEDPSNVKSIATHLSLVLKARPTAEQKLREQFSSIESTLENDLRGFSGLLDLVLEENTIRLNSCEVLEKLPEEFQPLAEQFNRLVQQIDALADLEMVFDIGNPHVLTLLFLLSLEEIISIKFPSGGECARLLIRQWLASFNQASKLCEILASELDFSDFHSVLAHCHREGAAIQEIIIAFLCRASREPLVLPPDSYGALDEIIAQAGLLGLQPLVESGFIDLEGFPKGENVGKIFYVV